MATDIVFQIVEMVATDTVIKYNKYRKVGIE